MGTYVGFLQLAPLQLVSMSHLTILCRLRGRGDDVTLQLC